MKYAIILPDGAADDPLPQLGGRTPLQAARTPNMDWVSTNGRLGRMVTIPHGFTPGTDVGTLSLFGYDPHRYYSGRAPIEAAAKGLRVRPDELIFRCNFVTIADGRMKSFTADHIAQEEAAPLIEALNRVAHDGEPAFQGCAFHLGTSYRNLMVASNANTLDLKTQPPHDIPNQPVVDYLPRGAGQERVRAIMERAAAVLKDHPVNRARAAAKRDVVSNIWLWGQGRPTALEPFSKRFGVRGKVITGVDIIRGLALSMGMELIRVPGATGYLDTNYVGKGDYAVCALDECDLIVVHIEAVDEAAHAGNAEEKIKALEQTDTHIVGPLLNALRRYPEWRILIAPDHVTSTATTAHGAAPPPFCFAGTGVPVGVRRPFSEADATAGGWLLERSEQLMEAFFRS